MSVRTPIFRAASPDDTCDVSRCGAEADALIGWAPIGETPRAWYPYCAHHARPHRQALTASLAMFGATPASGPAARRPATDGRKTNVRPFSVPQRPAPPPSLFDDVNQDTDPTDWLR